MRSIVWPGKNPFTATPHHIPRNQYTDNPTLSDPEPYYYLLDPVYALVTVAI